MYCTTMVLIKIMVQSTSTKYILGTGYQVYENKLILVTKMYHVPLRNGTLQKRVKSTLCATVFTTFLECTIPYST
jgi:hypothetical protein